MPTTLLTSHGTPTISATASIVLPAGIADGSTALIVLQVVAGGTPTLSSGFTGWTVLDSGPIRTTNSHTWMFEKAVGSADSSTTISGVLSGSVRWSIASVVGPVTEDARAFATSTSLVSNPTVPAVTPVTNDCLDVIIGGLSGTNNAGAISSTPPTGFTEDEDSSSAVGTGNESAVYVAFKQLVGQAGTSQTATSLTTAPASRATMWRFTLAPAAAGNGAVTAVAATSTSLAVAPVLHVDWVQPGTPAASQSTANVPTVMGETVVSGGSTATFQSNANAPVVSGAAGVTAVAAASSASAVAPTVALGAGRTAVAATSTSLANAPVLSGTANITAVAATSTSLAVAPVVAAVVNATVTAVAATSSSFATPPSVTGQSIGGVAAVRAQSSSAAVAPTVQFDYTLTAVHASSTSLAVAPTVAAFTGVTVTAVAATSTSLAVAPVVAGMAVVSATRATSTSLAVAPTLFGGTAGIVVVPVPAVSTSQAPVPVPAGGITLTGVAATSTSLARPPLATGGATVTATYAAAVIIAYAPTVAGTNRPDRDITLTVGVGPQRWTTSAGSL